MLRSLDFLYTPSRDVDADVRACAELGGELVWRIAAAGTVVAAVALARRGPLLLFADHLDGRSPIALYRVDDHAGAVARLRGSGIVVREVELPPGPCATFALAGARLGVYELTRPDVLAQFAERSR
jgi:hypothetical protein